MLSAAGSHAGVCRAFFSPNYIGNRAFLYGYSAFQHRYRKNSQQGTSDWMDKDTFLDFNNSNSKFKVEAWKKEEELMKKLGSHKLSQPTI
jgi:hypothetical protein